MQFKTTFQLDRELDKKVAFNFLNIKAGGIDFAQGIIGVHPELEGLQTEKDETIIKKRINDHFDFFYFKHQDYLNKRVLEFQKDWDKVKSDFLVQVKKLFKDKIYFEASTGLLSIIDCNPRFLEDKSFQVFYFHPQGVKYVASHEILHFLFYDYALKNYPDIFKKMDTEQGLFWDLAEIFNFVILSLPEFKAIHNQNNITFYPEHEKYLKSFQKIWNQEKDIDKWILEALDIFMTINIRSNF